MKNGYVKRGISYLRRNGITSTVYKAAERLLRDKDEKAYNSIAQSMRPDDETVKMQRERKFERAYKFSILVPVYETPLEVFRKMLASVGNQTYTNWELILVDASKSDERRNIVRDFCEEFYLECSDSYGRIHDKVKYIYLDSNKGISENTNAALNNATGDYVVLLDHDDCLSVTALFDVMWNISEKELIQEDGVVKLKRIMAVYSDEDKVNEDDTEYFDHHIKPDYDPILLCSNNYICHLFVVERSLAMSVGGFKSEYDGAQDHDFILRCLEGLKREQIIHIPKVLYHWRSSKSSTAANPSAKLYAYESGRRAVTDHLMRMGVKAKVVNTPSLGFFRIDYENLHRPVVSLAKKKFDEMSQEQINSLAQDFLLILSEDLKPLNPLYIEKMMCCMQHDYVGAVTGKIIGSNGKVESAGFDVANGRAVPRFSGLNRHFSGYLHRASLQQLVGGFSDEVVLVRTQAVQSYKPELKLKDGYSVYYEPEVVFKRK